MQVRLQDPFHPSVPRPRIPGRRVCQRPNHPPSLLPSPPMKRVTGIGGIFIKSKQPEVLREWYRTHLGFELEPWGGLVFRWAGPDNPTGTGSTVWSTFEDSDKYFAPSKAPFMVNYRVADLHALIAVLRAEGCTVDPKVEESEYGKFGWVMDPDGNRIELWQPPAGQ